jgi:hypothetical protein
MYSYSFIDLGILQSQSSHILRILSFSVTFPSFEETNLHQETPRENIEDEFEIGAAEDDIEVCIT